MKKRPVWENRIKTATALLLAGMVMLLAVLFIAMDKKEFSENENRYLAEFPSVSLEKIKSGEYMSGLESYLADHFPFRDFFMGVKTKAEMSAGKREINGIYIAKDGYLIEEYEKPENTERIGKILGSFAKELEGQEVDVLSLIHI